MTVYSMKWFISYQTKRSSAEWLYDLLFKIRVKRDVNYNNNFVKVSTKMNGIKSLTLSDL